MDLTYKIDDLLNLPCYVIDPLPYRVPNHGEGQYFAVEEFLREDAPLRRLYEKFTAILLKLNCYYDIQVSCHNQWERNPAPEQLAAHVMGCLESGRDDINLVLETPKAMVTVSGDDLYMSLYSDSDTLNMLMEKLALSEGLFLWKT